jgi:hypothetical protein
MPEIEPIPSDPGAPPAVRLSRWSRALLGTLSLLIALVTAVQLAALFLEAAPANTVSQRYHTQLTWWVEPWLEQDWKLFAPDPQSSNTTIRARVRGVDGAVSSWIDVTAADYAAITYDPMPSQLNQNQLRRAWSAYTGAVANGEPADTARSRLLEQYVAEITTQRLAADRVPGPYRSVQLEAVNTPITPPGASAKDPTTRMTPRIVP